MFLRRMLARTSHALCTTASTSRTLNSCCNSRQLSSDTATRSSQNAIEKFIHDKIRATGPMTLAEYMQLCARNYYTTTATPTLHRPLFGAHGDFLTAPEVSQLFGELLAVWLTYERRAMGYVSGEFQLIECGAGSGTLIVDILRAMHQMTADACIVSDLHSLIERQHRALCNDDKASSLHVANARDALYTHTTVIPPHRFGNQQRQPIRVRWYADLQDLCADAECARFSLIVANEYLDALPVHQFSRRAGGEWREVMVDMKANSDRLQWRLSAGDTINSKAWLPELLRNDRNRVVYEVCPLAGCAVNLMYDHIRTYGGCALIVDYGHNGDRLTESVRAYHQHTLVDVLDAARLVADITADVNYSFLVESLKTTDACVFGAIEQGTFLRACGYDARLERLLAVCSKNAERDAVRTSAEYLVKPAHMGSRFKVMAILPGVLRDIFRVRHAPLGFLGAEIMPFL